MKGIVMKNDIIFLMVDQLSAKWLETALENEICPLPNIRKLKDNGVTFCNAISNNPVCCPARSTIATGLTSRGHGVLENGYHLNPNIPTFMKSLQEAGYCTGAFGKCHFIPHQEGLNTDYHAYGFDVTRITEDSRGGEWLDWVMEEYPEHLDAVLATIWSTYIPEYESYGKDNINLKKQMEKIQHNFQWATDAHPKDSSDAYVLPYPKELSQTVWITTQACQYIENMAENTPMYAHISYVQPHNPYEIPEGYLELVDSKAIPKPVPPEWKYDADTPEYFKRQQEFHFSDDSYARQCYMANLVFLDEQFGKILQSLEKKNRLGECYIFFISDHGDMLGDHGFYFKEERHYDACIRVPLIMYGPDLCKGITRDEMIQFTDICPTVLDIAGTHLPKMPVSGPYLHMQEEDYYLMHGSSILDLCKGAEEPSRDTAYCESYNPIWSYQYSDWVRTVRTREYRYSYYAGNGGEQLFDIKNDPDEQHNLAKLPEYAGIKQQLKDSLLECIIRQDWPITRRELFALGVH